ncbi:dnaJ -like protein [Labeo rohita]|uniref:DnaJ-like protein n=1 Tax=Labeo rohita TaxID=84645 RepID=A0A498N475_LABRO|nr:dnaJ -like protein [Labeo rohita]RXN27581.1 dnaJ -like protein [Labeo rohita]
MMLSSVDPCAMAEVRLRFLSGAYKLLKPQNLPLLDKNYTPVATASYVAGLINLPELCVIRNDRVEAAKRPAALESPKGTANTLLTGAGGVTNSLKVPLDLHSGNVNVWTDCHGLKFKSKKSSSCLGTDGKLLLSSHTGTHFQRQLRRSIYKKTLYASPKDFLGQFVSFTRAYSGTDSPLYKSKSAYYDILEVSPTATHAQIKTAYYKQSFIYHPDKNAGSEEAVFRFSQISEAYNVLGNKALRRKYDRGILSQADLHGSSKPTGRESPASGQQSRSRDSPSVGATQQNIFDFDTFIRSHYGEQLKREQEIRQRREEIIRKKEELVEDMKLGRLKEITVGVMLVTAMMILFSLKSTK